MPRNTTAYVTLRHCHLASCMTWAVSQPIRILKFPTYSRVRIITSPIRVDVGINNTWYELRISCIS